MQGGDAVEDIKGRLSIEEVVGDYLELKRAGRNLKARSPFSNEKTPSFMVSPEKQIWHDFSSGRGGNMFSFIMEVEGVDFRGALEILARKAGIDIEQYRSSGSAGAGKLKKRLIEATALAARYFQQALVKSAPAKEYLIKKRAFNRETLEEFALGYAPDGFDGLTKALKKRGFTDEELVKAGLSTPRRGGLGDMFRGRITIPLRDPQGQTIGFTARILEDIPNAPKYLNTPQTLLYDKGRHVFALSEAKQAIRSAGYVVMVEGNLDVISSHQAGVKQVIATAGTALTEHHLKALGRFTSDIRIAFDQDDAGLRATERAIALASQVGIKLGVIDVPEGKDPDELVRKNPDAWRKAVNEPLYAMEWLRARYQKLHNITTAPGKKAYADLMLAMIHRLSDEVEQEHYLGILATDLDASKAAVLSKYNQPIVAPKRSLRNVAPIAADPYVYQDQLLGLLVRYPTTRRVLETIDDEPVLSNPLRQQVFDYIALHPHDSITEVPEDLHKIEDYVKILLVLAEELYAEFDANERLRESNDLVHRMQNDYQKSEIHNLTAAIREAEERGDVEKIEQLLAKFNKVVHPDKE